jgi:hypothetical protein
VRLWRIWRSLSLVLFRNIATMDEKGVWVSFWFAWFIVAVCVLRVLEESSSRLSE